MDVKDLMAAAKQLKERLASAQQQAQADRAEVETGGGLVKVVMNGKSRVESIRIDKGCLGQSVRDDDLRLLEELLLTAYNKAAEDVERRHKDRMSGLAGEFGVNLSDLDIPGKMPP